MQMTPWACEARVLPSRVAAKAFIPPPNCGSDGPRQRIKKGFLRSSRLASTNAAECSSSKEARRQTLTVGLDQADGSGGSKVCAKDSFFVVQ